MPEILTKVIDVFSRLASKHQSEEKKVGNSYIHSTVIRCHGNIMSQILPQVVQICLKSTKVQTRKRSKAIQSKVLRDSFL